MPSDPPPSPSPSKGRLLRSIVDSNSASETPLCKNAGYAPDCVIVILNTSHPCLPLILKYEVVISPILSTHKIVLDLSVRCVI